MEATKKMIDELASVLYQAEKDRDPIPPLTDGYPNLLPEEAYQVQLAWVKLKEKEGACITGKKIGLTSKPMQELMGVNEPDYGHLFDYMMISDRDTINADELLQPRIEAEVAFILEKDLKGPGVTVADVLAATKYVVPSIEVVDSRIENWKIKLSDTIADNGSSARVVLGSKLTPVDGLDLQLMGMVLEKNGQQVNTGAGAAALGHPAYAIAWLANKLAQFDISLKAGEVILPGAVAAAVDVKKGDHITAHFSGIGSVSVSFG